MQEVPSDLARFEGVSLMTQQADVVVVGGGVDRADDGDRPEQAGMRTLVWMPPNCPGGPPPPSRERCSAVPSSTEAPSRRGHAGRPLGLRKIFNEHSPRARTPASPHARGRLVSQIGGPGTPPWARDLPGFAECSLRSWRGSPSGFWITSPVADMPCSSTTTWSTGCARRSGDIEVCTVCLASKAASTAVAPVVINCAGVAGGTLACDDSVTPVRGAARGRREPRAGPSSSTRAARTTTGRGSFLTGTASCWAGTRASRRPGAWSPTRSNGGRHHQALRRGRAAPGRTPG